MRSMLVVLTALSLCAGSSWPGSAVQALASTQGPLSVRAPYAAHVTIPRDTLLAQGWSSSALANLQVRRHTQLIASELDATGLHFISETNQSPFSSQSVYWLSVENNDTSETPRIPAADQALSWAPDQVYSSLAHARGQDGWFAAELRPDTEPVQIALTLPQALPVASKLELQLAAQTDTEHSLLVALNGSPAKTLHWQSAAFEAGTYTITTPCALAAGALTLEIALASAAEDSMLLESISLPEVRMPLPALTITQLEEVQNVASTDADTLLIGASALLPALQPLVAAHEALGERVALVPVQAAYDRYSFGERDPNAIRSLIRDWQPRPQRVILLGDGSLRMRDPLDGPDMSIPPFIVNADPKNGAVPCDTCYVRLDTDDPLDDLMPDLAIGRLPVHTQAEAAALADKIAAALLRPVPGSWSKQALVVVDNDQDELGNADPAGPFTPLAAQAASLMNGMQLRNFAYTPGQTSPSGRYSTAAALREELFSAWNAGAGLLLYIGHASPWQWAWTSSQESTPYIFSIYDAARLNNGKRLPILISFSCQSGNSFHPELESSDERLLLRQEGGIIASLSPVGSAVIHGHSTLAAAVIPALNSHASLGEAHLAGMRSLIESGRDLDLAFSYQLLGDPDLRLPQASQISVFLPGVQR